MGRVQYEKGEELSPLQIEVLQFAARGYTAAAAAAVLGKTRDNVMRARRIARQKLGVPNIREAVRHAKAEGYSIMPRPMMPTTRPSQWVREWARGDEHVDHLHGVPWHDAAYPHPKHECLPQTCGMVRVQGLPPMRIARCACGAVDFGDGWTDRNSRYEQPGILAR